VRSVDTLLRGRREAALLALPSVRHMASVLAKRCREPSWIRTTVAALDRFATLTANEDLEGLLERARCDPRAAQTSLIRFAEALEPAAPQQIAALVMAPKLWFTFNGVAVAWSNLARGTTTSGTTTNRTFPNTSGLERFVLLALIGSGLRRAELLRIRLGDVGALDADGALVADLAADPLAVRFVQARGARAFVTFLSDPARSALLADMARRRAAGEELDAQTPLVGANGAAATARTVARAGRINASLIEAGNALNVDLCRTTGDFFRTWGMPGARFAAAHPGVEEAV